MGSVKRYLQAASVGTLNRRKRAGTVGLLADTPPKQAAVEEERRSRRISFRQHLGVPEGRVLRHAFAKPARKTERKSSMYAACQPCLVPWMGPPWKLSLVLLKAQTVCDSVLGPWV